jgi:hypothetical protein
LTWVQWEYQPHWWPFLQTLSSYITISSYGMVHPWLPTWAMGSFLSLHPIAVAWSRGDAQVLSHSGRCEPLWGWSPCNM